MVPLARAAFSAALLLFSSLYTASAFAEVGRDPTYELLRMRQMQREDERMQKELAEPIPVDVPANRPALGPKTAPVLLVVFSDFQCPHCARGAKTVEDLRKKYGTKVRFVFRNFPMPMHPFARPAANWFTALAMQSGAAAYKFHDIVFTEQEKLTTDGEKFLEAAAKRAGGDVVAAKKVLDSDAVKKRVAEDEEAAKKFGFDGTPGFVVGGVVMKGAYPIDRFEKIIDARLKGRSVTSAKN